MGLLWLKGTNAYALSGTVKDKRGTAIAGASVSLVSDASSRWITDANGEFTFGQRVSTKGGAAPRTTGRNLAGLGIRENSFQLLIPSATPAGSITLFGIHRKKRIDLPIGPFDAGAHLVDLPRLSPGAYSLWIDLGPFSGSAHLVHAGSRTTLMGRNSGVRHATADARNAQDRTRRIAAAVDSLLVEKAGFIPARIPITSYDQTGIAIVMAPVPGRNRKLA